MSAPKPSDPPANRRVLVVDDNLAIHDDFRKILGSADAAVSDMDAEAAALFGEAAPQSKGIDFELEFAQQGQEALEKVVAARQANRPFAAAFVDMRMPPGWDGLTTIVELWKADPELQTVICTAYSDRSWEEIHAALTTKDRWLVLKKPFDTIEVLQMANSLTEKWTLARMARAQMDLLEGMVAARTQELVAAQRVQSEFLTNASHELLTPMNGVCGFLELLSTTPLDVEQADFLKEAQTSSEHLHRLIQRILDFNQAGNGSLAARKEAFAPAEVLQNIVREHASQARAKGLALQTHVVAEAATAWMGPREVVHKTLGLLVDNAIKFTPKGSVTLGVSPCATGLEFSVRDTGVGLTSEQLEWIQIPFAQVDGGSCRRSSGIGLGLPLAHRLVRSAGGCLRLDGAPQRGVCASFSVEAVRAR